MLKKVKLSWHKLTHCVPTQGVSVCQITWLISALTLLVGYRKDIWPVKNLCHSYPKVLIQHKQMRKQGKLATQVLYKWTCLLCLFNYAKMEIEKMNQHAVRVRTWAVFDTCQTHDVCCPSTCHCGLLHSDTAPPETWKHQGPSPLVTPWNSVNFPPRNYFPIAFL